EWCSSLGFPPSAVLGALLDRTRGMSRLAPDGVNAPAARRYLPGTMVLETSWGARTGWLIVRDALLIGAWHRRDERSKTYRRTPTDYDADHTFVRLLRCVNGEVQLNQACEPVFDYGRIRGQWEY